MYHIDRHPTKEFRKKKDIKGDNPVEYLYDVRPAYTGIGFELYWTDDIEFAYEVETFDEVKELLEIAKKDPDYKYAYFLKLNNVNYGKFAKTGFTKIDIEKGEMK